jgi:glycosyltransferase involved in cell wall biosynthesis
VVAATHSGRVSVVIACRNEARYIGESVESALAQTVPAFEIVVVDDESTDDSAQIVRSIPGVALASLPRGGVSVARNHGWQSTSGEFVVFHDADDRLLPNAIEAGLDAFALHPECGFVYGFAHFIDAGGASIGTVHAPRRVTNANYASLLAGSPPAPASAAMFRRAALEAVDGFRVGQELAEDVDLYLRVARAFPVFCHEVTITEYRRHRSNSSARSPSRTLRACHATLERQRPEIRDEPGLLAALEDGKRYFNGILGEPVAHEMFGLLRAGRIRKALGVLPVALRYAPRSLLRVSVHYVVRLPAVAGKALSSISRSGVRVW